MKLIPILAILVLAPFASAQDTANPNSTSNTQDSPYTDKEDHRGFWQATLPGGSYLVALSKIVTVSQHEYLLDGTLVVNEVIIDTVGDALVRIYQITPAAENSNLNTPQKVLERGRDLLDRAGQRTGADFKNSVHKTYPGTTHSKIIEFRVEDLQTLGALKGSVTRAWMTGRGRKFTVNE